MAQINFKLEIFEGPLDLLLHLISKHKLNINDIPITILVDQYLDYISSVSEQNMELAGDFLEMAAHLIYMKTVSLLPQREEAEQMKKELEGRLIEYSLCKKAARLMQDKYIGSVVTVRSPMKIKFDNTYPLIHEPDILLEAYLAINVKALKDEPVRQESFNTIVKKKIVSVTSRIIYVLRRLYKNGSCMMDGLFDGITDRSERVAVFLAILELTKSGRVLLNEDNTRIDFNRDYSGRDKNSSDSDYDNETENSQ